METRCLTVLKRGWKHIVTGADGIPKAIPAPNLCDTTA